MKKNSTASTNATRQLARQWQRLQTWFDALAPREKIIVALVCLALVVMLVQLLALDPLLSERDRMQKALQQSSQDINALQLEVQTLNQAIVAGPKRQKQKQVEALQGEVERLDQQIAKTTNAMIPARLMTDVLRDVLTLRRDLRLVSLQNLQPQPLLSDDDVKATGTATTGVTNTASPNPPVATTDPNAALSGEVGLYRHGVTLVFEGDYMATLQFLQALEQKPWRFFWQQLQYDVEKYPTARVTLTLYTLSPERAWLGV